MWRRINQRFTVDVSVGLCEQVDQALGHLAMFPPAAATPLYSSSSSAGGDALRHPGTGGTQHHPGGAVFGCLPDFLKKLDDGVSMLVGFVHSRDECHMFASERFAHTFLSSEELGSAFETAGVLPDLLLAQ